MGLLAQAARFIFSISSEVRFYVCRHTISVHLVFFLALQIVLKIRGGYTQNLFGTDLNETARHILVTLCAGSMSFFPCIHIIHCCLSFFNTPPCRNGQIRRMMSFQLNVLESQQDFALPDLDPVLCHHRIHHSSSQSANWTSNVAPCDPRIGCFLLHRANPPLLSPRLFHHRPLNPLLHQTPKFMKNRYLQQISQPLNPSGREIPRMRIDSPSGLNSDQHF